MYSDENLSYSYQQYLGFSKFLKDNSIQQIRLATCSSNVIALCSDSPIPAFFIRESHQTFLPKPSKPINSPITSIALSPCGKYCVTGHKNGQIIFWDVTGQNSISDITLDPDVPIQSLSFQSSYRTLFAAQGTKLNRIQISSLLLFFFMKVDLTFSLTQPILHLFCVSSIDNSIQLIAAQNDKSVTLFTSTESEVSPFNDFPLPNCPSNSEPIVSLSNHEWHFFLAIGAGQNLTIYKICENGDHEETANYSFSTAITSAVFVSRFLLAISTSSDLYLANVQEAIVGRYEATNFKSDIILSQPGTLFFVPSDTTQGDLSSFTFETYVERIKNLKKTEQFGEAVDLAVGIYCGESLQYDCVDSVEILQQLLKDSLLLFVSSPSFSEKDYPRAAEALVRGDLCSLVLSDLYSLETLTPSAKLQILVLMVESDSLKPDATSLVLEEIGKLNPIGNEAVEEALLSAQFAPTFVQEAINIGHELHFSRFMLTLFDRFFDDILPPFALIVDSGDPQQISRLCDYIFMHKPFQSIKTDLCIIWLHAPNTGRLETVLSSDWHRAADLERYFLSRAPIKFSSAQSLSALEMIRVAFLCLQNAPTPDADDFFTLIASFDNSQRDGREFVPAAAVPSVIKYLFKSEASREIRERLFLQIVDNDYSNIFKDILGQFKLQCVRAGFANIVQRLAPNDYELLAKAILLSDHPEDVFNLLEKCQRDTSTQAALTSLFRPLLYLNPQRLVKLVVEKYPALHPDYILNKSADKGDIKLYFDTLFAIDPPIARPEDTKSYLRFLTHHIKNLVFFLRHGQNYSLETASEFCEFQRIHIGRAVLSAGQERYQIAFDAYASHVHSGGQYDSELTETFLAKINDIDYPKPIIIRTLLEPIVADSSLSSEILKSILQKAEKTLMETIDEEEKSLNGYKRDVAVAAFSLLMVCPDGPMKQVLDNYVKNAGCFIELSSGGDADIFTSLVKMLQKKNEQYTDGTVYAIDYSMGVAVFSTQKMLHKEREMTEDLSRKVRQALQRGEIDLLIKDQSVPQDQEAMVILLNHSSDQHSVLMNL